MVPQSRACGRRSLSSIAFWINFKHCAWFSCLMVHMSGCGYTSDSVPAECVAQKCPNLAKAPPNAQCTKLETWFKVPKPHYKCTQNISKPQEFYKCRSKIWVTTLFKNTSWARHVIRWDLHPSFCRQLGGTTLAQIHVRHSGVSALGPRIRGCLWVQVQSPEPLTTETRDVSSDFRVFFGGCVFVFSNYDLSWLRICMLTLRDGLEMIVGKQAED